MPSSVLIFGGSGKLAKLITTRLISKNHSVTSIIRRPEHIPELVSLGATPVIQSIEDSTVADIADVIKTSHPDAIIFAAGGGWRALKDPNFSLIVDRDAAIRVFDAVVEAAGTKRLLMTSTVDARNRDVPRPEWYTDEDQKVSDELWGMLPVYMEAKFAADRDLVEGNAKRGLEYTIIRPTWYDNDGEWTGKVSAGRVGMIPKVSREDVADVFVACIENDETIGRVFEVVGGDVPVEDAVRRAAEEKIDSFGKEYR
jgi:nucleoside-diphosphate-sugar epimerase